MHWLCISLWIVVSTLTSGGEACVVKANPTLNVRKSPSTNAPIVDSLHQGTTVKCLETQSGFCRVGTDRWASAEYINCGTSKSSMAGFQFSLSQGSYSSSVAASAGTHDGGGAIDVRTSLVNNEKKKVDTMVVALRKAGFAAWSRGRVADSFENNKHIHAIAIADTAASSGAKSQVASFKRGRNGLKGDGVDPDAYLGRATPAWAN